MYDSGMICLENIVCGKIIIGKVAWKHSFVSSQGKDTVSCSAINLDFLDVSVIFIWEVEVKVSYYFSVGMLISVCIYI